MAERNKDEEDIKELKEVLGSVSEFISSIKEPIKDLLSILMDQLSGDKLGKDVAAFYYSLKDSGMDEDTVKEMTKEYFNKRLEMANVINIIQNLMSRTQGKGEIKEMIKGKIQKKLGEKHKRNVQSG